MDLEALHVGRQAYLGHADKPGLVEELLLHDRHPQHIEPSEPAPKRAVPIAHKGLVPLGGVEKLQSHHCLPQALRLELRRWKDLHVPLQAIINAARGLVEVRLPQLEHVEAAHPPDLQVWQPWVLATVDPDLQFQIQTIL